MKKCMGVAVSCLLLWGSQAAFAQSLFSPTQDPLAGSRVFGTKGCVKCHAVNGVGGKVAPDLGRIPRPRSFYELAAEMWNHLPKMGERMRELGIVRPQLDPRETGDLIAFSTPSTTLIRQEMSRPVGGSSRRKSASSATRRAGPAGSSARTSTSSGSSALPS